MHKDSFDRLLLDLVVENASHFLGVIHPDTECFLFVNEKGMKMFGIDSGEDLTQLAYFKMLNLPEVLHQRVKKELEEKGYWTEEIWINAFNGKPFWAELKMDRLEVSGTSHLLLHIANIDERKKFEIKLLEEQRHSNALFNSASIAIIVCNQEGEIVMFNAFAEKMFGYAPGEAIGQKVEILIPGRFSSQHTSHRDSYYEQPSSRPMGIGMNLFAIKKDGTEFPVEISLGNYQTDQGKFAIAYVIDIGLRKRQEEELLAQKQELEKRSIEIQKLNQNLEKQVESRTYDLQETLKSLEESKNELRVALEKEKELGELKSRFVSMASHEFRTPLSAIASSASLISKYPKDEDQEKREKHIARIKNSVNNLNDILNEFLSLGKLEEGKIHVRRENFNIKEFTDTLLHEMHPILKQGQRTEYYHEGDEQVNLDRSLLRNVMINLISNAIKFSPENSPIVVKSKTNTNQFIFEVRDYGMGISEDDQVHLFERFFRGRNVTHVQGTGLGLHIVGKYVELMEGTIRCESKLNEGTKFIIHLKND